MKDVGNDDAVAAMMESAACKVRNENRIYVWPMDWYSIDGR